ncbi:peptidoglycan-binding domain-containing protein [Leptothermofonsia sp. ETS-13]|uniref:peptidoglycan-binding domain-containing protein n=1 Tax=Leptothermofonsia sp. ETS-13 TaxID=3035696 RepID=UPI003B9E30A8
MVPNEFPAEIVSAIANPALYEGDFGPAVVEQQKLLNAKGANLPIDVFFWGPMTKAAVILFQQQHGLIPDGTIGSVVWRELCKGKPPIRLEDVCLFYKPLDFPHQTEALQWLQDQIPTQTLDEFDRRWHQKL